MGKKKRDNCFFTENYWQSSNFNQRSFTKNMSMLLSLAMNRFRWENLPNTCDARFLEWALHRNGIATICFEKDMPDVWQSLFAMPFGEFDAYGIPVQW